MSLLCAPSQRQSAATPALQLNTQLALLNARSICNKSELVAEILCEYKIDILAITERWIKKDNDSFNNAIFNMICKSN
jgi:hypothetical protein